MLTMPTPQRTNAQVLFSSGGEELLLYRNVFSNYPFEWMSSAIPWQQNSIKVYGKVYQEPRLTAWYGPPYRYSSIIWPACPLSQWLAELSGEVSSMAGFEFNSVLANFYRDGRDSMGWHRDNEPEMDPSVIASVSFGATRKFAVREKYGSTTLQINLEHGSLLLMNYFQQRWEHSIPKTTRLVGGRINLTFRSIIHPAP